MARRGTQRWWALAAISLAVLAVTLDVTVLTVALPTLATALGASESELQWFVTAYTLALVAGMLPAGLLGDRLGRKRVLLGALGLFTLGSIGCAVAPDPLAFIVARIALGLAGSALIVVALATVTVLFDETERPRAIGIWGAANFIGLPLGPILGGWILSNAWWGWIFLMNVPVAVVGMLAVVRLVPESRAARPPAIDLPGVVLSSAGLVAIMYGLVEAGAQGWSSMAALGWELVGLVLLALFGLWERRVSARPGGEPLVDLTLFRSRSFTWGVICTAFGIFGLFGAMFALPQYFEAVMGSDPQGSGLRLLPLVGGLVVGALPADRIAARLSSRIAVTVGLAGVVVGLAIGSTMTATSTDAFFGVWTFVLGAGGGLAFATAASVAMVEISPDRSGIASGLLQAVVKLGPAFGASILGSVLNATYRAQVDVAGLPAAAAAVVQDGIFGAIAIARQAGSPALLASAQAAFVAGMSNALLVAAGAAFVGALLALIFLPARSPAPDRREAQASQHEGVSAG